MGTTANPAVGPNDLGKRFESMINDFPELKPKVSRALVHLLLTIVPAELCSLFRCSAQINPNLLVVSALPVPAAATLPVPAAALRPRSAPAHAVEPIVRRRRESEMPRDS